MEGRQKGALFTARYREKGVCCTQAADLVLLEGGGGDHDHSLQEAWGSGDGGGGGRGPGDTAPPQMQQEQQQLLQQRSVSFAPQEAAPPLPAPLPAPPSTPAAAGAPAPRATPRATPGALVFPSGEPPLLYVDATVAEGSVERLPVWRDSDLSELAGDFAEKHALPRKMARRLEKLIAEQRDAIALVGGRA